MGDRVLRWRDLPQVIAAVLAESVLLVVLWAAGPVLGSVPLTHLGSWVQVTAPSDALTALVRLAGMVLAGWLLVSTVLYLGASLAGAEGLVRRTGWVTLPVVRRMVDGFAAASILASTVTVSASGAFSATLPRHTAIARSVIPRPLAAANRNMSGRVISEPTGAVAVSDLVVGRHLPHPGRLEHPTPISYSTPVAQAPSASNDFAGLAPGTKVVVVLPGDCLSVIAERHLGDWRLDAEIHQLNVGRLQPDGRALSDDHWIYPGWVLVMPTDAVGTQIVPGPSGPTATSTARPAPAPSIPTPTTQPTTTSVPQARTSPAASHQSRGARSIGAVTGTPPQATRGPLAAPAVSPTPLGKRPPAPAANQHQVEGALANIPIAPIIGVGGLAAAGVIWRLGRHRRNQMHNRRTGRGVPANPPAVVAAETQARAIADDTAMRWVDAGLRYLGGQMAGRLAAATESIDSEKVDAAVVPSVVLVRAGARGLEVMISPSSPDAPEGWDAIDEGSVWTLRPEDTREELETRAAGRWSFLPALVTVGSTVDGAVLANLEHAGSLAVEGDPDVVRAVLAQVLLELTSQPWADEMLDGLHAVGDIAVRQLPGVEMDSDPMALAETLDRAADRAADALGGSPSVAARRAVDGEWLPRVAVAFAGSDREAVRCLIEAAAPDRSGVAVVADGAAVEARWRLTVDADGNATLAGLAGDHPFRLALRLEARPDVIAVLGQALITASEPPSVDLSDVVEPISEGVYTTARGPVAAGEVEIRILGTVSVAGGSGSVEAVRRDAPLAVLAYLATRPGPVSIGDLTAALWPPNSSKERFGTPAPKTVHNVVSRARVLVGRETGGAHRILADHGGYVLAPSVTTDWGRFQTLAQMARHASSPEESMSRYREALELVQGRPFAGNLDSHFFEWVSAEQLEHVITATIVDMAEGLATSALEAGDAELVLWAVERGLAIDPVREELYRCWMRALGSGSDTIAVTKVWDRLCAALQEHIDPTQEPSPESQGVYRSSV